MHTSDKRPATHAAPVATVCRLVCLQSVVGVKWALTLREEHHLPCAPCANLGCTAPPLGLALCLARAKLEHSRLVALFPLRAFLAQSELSKTSLGSLLACRAFPACIVPRWASALRPAPVEQDHTLLAVLRHPLAPIAALVHFSLHRGKHRACPAVQACIAPRLALPSKLASVLLVRTL